MKKNALILCLSLWLMLGCDNDQETATPTEPVVAPEAESMEVVEQSPEVIEEAVEEVAAVEPEPEPVVQQMSGEQVFKKHCFSCHMTGAANAPKVGDVAAWEPRIAKGMEELLLSAINGIPNTAMMAKGTCNACSEDELMAAIEFMVNQSR